VYNGLMPLVTPQPGPPSRRAGTPDLAVEFDRVSFAFDEKVVLRELSFAVPHGSTVMLLGASGAGKSIVLKLILGLLRPDSGSIRINGQPIEHLPEGDLMVLRADIGMLFQETALFDSLTVAENVGYRLYEESDMPVDEAETRIAEVLGFVGLAPYGERMPSELSGGQRRRVAIARAMASKPNLLLFDDPTTGLDPVIATSVDQEIIKLRDLQHVTSILVTHQIRDAFYVATHEAVRRDGTLDFPAISEERATFMVLHEGRKYFEGSGAELLASDDAFLKEFLYRTLPPW
jgi:phospholipid/cholesterol/gamma-HCH transport system ATP-binding protein